MMRRRDFNTGLLIAGIVIQPLLAQESAKQRRIAIVAAGGKPENISDAGSSFWRAFSRSCAAWAIPRGEI
jgi:hypothetical protein